MNVLHEFEETEGNQCGSGGWRTNQGREVDKAGGQLSHGNVGGPSVSWSLAYTLSQLGNHYKTFSRLGTCGKF